VAPRSNDVTEYWLPPDRVFSAIVNIPLPKDIAPPDTFGIPAILGKNLIVQIFVSEEVSTKLIVPVITKTPFPYAIDA